MKKKIGEDDGDAWRELGDRQWSHEELGSFNGGKGLEGGGENERKMRERKEIDEHKSKIERRSILFCAG
ncbi:hypothetical protein AAC387_Pa11g0003 [Persea americana]